MPTQPTNRERFRQWPEPQRIMHWGEVCEFTQHLLDKTFGDGQKLLQLFPINERPRYWLVLVDSCCDEESLWDILDDIYEAIDEQFGTPSDGDERPYFPMHDGEGCCWRWPSAETSLTKGQSA